MVPCLAVKANIGQSPSFIFRNQGGRAGTKSRLNTAEQVITKFSLSKSSIEYGPAGREGKTSTSAKPVSSRNCTRWQHIEEPGWVSRKSTCLCSLLSQVQ